ncbi:DUF4846 domain-containing protein [Desulfococcaceae bacterium HSG9]|nr:DUF4846 domain-containing protein [Desulfococcaceae bacterium HSG9]
MKPIYTFLFIVVILNLNCCASSNSQADDIQITIEKQEKKAERIIPQNETQYKVIKDIPTPDGYTRIDAGSNSYAEYLRNLPLKQENNIVFLYNGDKKFSQAAQFVVIDIDVGKRDLQQCADAVMRLRGEYLFKNQRYGEIHFNFLRDGKPRYYTKFAGSDRSHKKFRKYMDYIFAYANTASLHNEMAIVKLKNMQIGDVFIEKGRPYGHAISVVDMAENTETDDKIFMLVQSYMPAQEMHILKNMSSSKFSPWYSINFGEILVTPEWNFTKNDLKRFRN